MSEKHMSDGELIARAIVHATSSMVASMFLKDPSVDALLEAAAKEADIIAEEFERREAERKGS